MSVESVETKIMTWEQTRDVGEQDALCVIGSMPNGPLCLLNIAGKQFLFRGKEMIAAVENALNRGEQEP